MRMEGSQRGEEAEYIGPHMENYSVNNRNSSISHSLRLKQYYVRHDVCVYIPFSGNVRQERI